ncbi:MAG: lipopolysaccharide heptosyltransferase II [Woeseiaceae bacterium]
MRPSTTLSSAALIVGPSWVGDMVMAQSLFKLLKAEQPARTLDVLAPAWSLPLVARMPEIRRGIAAETGHGELGLGKRRRIARALREERYEQAIVLPRSFKSALIPWLAGIPRRTGFRGESRFGLINDVRAFDPRVLDQTVKRFLALGEGSQDTAKLVKSHYPGLVVDGGRQQALLQSLELDGSRPVVAMMPGAEYGPAKCWPLDYFAALARQLDDSGYAVWVFGSDKDRSSGDVIAGNSEAINLCGKTTLADVIDLLGYAEQAVSNDSGLMHIAAAVGIHVHGIYGSSSPHFTPPLTERADVHYLDLECSPCFARECPLGHLRCLTELKPEALFARISRAGEGAGRFGDISK